jgi:hypothetical protein
MVGPFPVGLLSHSHTWAGERHVATEQVSLDWWTFDRENATHPRETLALLCVADLAAWSTLPIVYEKPKDVAKFVEATPAQVATGATAIYQFRAHPPPAPVGVLIANLFAVLARKDAALRPMSEGLLLTRSLGSRRGFVRLWDLDAVFSAETRTRILMGDLSPARLPFES